jgi:hypothetical protein
MPETMPETMPEKMPETTKGREAGPGPEILTFGCRLNIYESEVMRRHAEAGGEADRLVIVNTCAVTAEAVAHHYRHILEGKVERFDLPGINGLNFLLQDVLGGGGTASLRNDPQGKAYAQMLLDFPVPVPKALAERDGLNAAA